MKNLSKQLAVVSGGASGMGAATARLLAKHGAKVIILDRNFTQAQQLAQEIQHADAYEIDVTDPQAVEKTFLNIKDKYGIASICVNCAGVAPAAKMFNREGIMPLAEFSQVIQINLIGTFNMMRVASFYMSQLPDNDERGVIINTASVAAYEGQIGQTAYSASKAGIVGMTLPAARELARYKIRVMTIAPGIMNTPMLAAMPEQVRESLQTQIPYPARFGFAEEFAELALHIIINPYLNGEVIRLDAATRMAAK